jgi:hypothetical protein
MCCRYCVYRNSWDCGDGYYRRNNCSSFQLDWNMLSEFEKKIIQAVLENKSETEND